MSRQLSELETVLQQMVIEHRRLLAHTEKHASAMQAFDLAAMDDAGRLQHASRARIAMLDQRRRMLAQQIGKSLNVSGELTIRKLAELNPGRCDALMQIRAELKQLIEQIGARTHISGKLAAAVLGHLNLIVRLIAGAVEKAGLYTKNGIPKVSSRIGVMEAVG